MAFVLEEEEFASQEPESFLGKAKRGLMRSAARGAEAAVGLPGDIGQSLLSLTEYGAEKLGVPENIRNKVRDIAPLFVPGTGLPTSEDVKEKITEKRSGEYLKPRSKGEEISDEIVQDAVSLLIPGPGKLPKSAKGFKSLLRSIGIAAGGVGSKEIAKQAGVGEGGQTAAKLGAMLLLGTTGRGGPKKYVGKLYNEAEEAIKGNPKVSASSLEKNLSQLKSSLSKGLEAPTEKAVLSKINALEGKVKNGKIGVDELWASKRSINEELSKALFENPDKASQARAKKLFKKINKDINKELTKYGEQNKDFGKAFRSADEGFATLAKSNKIENFIRKNSKYSPASALLYPIMHMAPSPTVGAAVGAATAYKGGQLAYRLSKSPTLRKYYKEVLQSAAKENSAAMNRALQKMDKELMKDEKVKPSSSRYVLEDS
jgi:hypothetical protein